MPDKKFGLEPRQIPELSDYGLLWLINRVVFHPRGYALGITQEEDGEVRWVMLGDGNEIWTFNPADDDAEFAKVQVFFEQMMQSEFYE